METRFGIRIPPCADAATVGAFVADAERKGFDVAWLPDSQFIWRDVWSSLSLAATRTERITLGSCVTNFETRHATVSATAAATVEELATGRTIFGVGTGDSSVKTLGLKPTRLARMREQLALTRSLLDGETVTFEDHEMEIGVKPGTRIPIYMAANGPKSLALAGETCDGVIVLVGITPELIEQALSHIRDGAERAGRDFDGIDVCLGTFSHVTDDPTLAARITKPYCVAAAQTGNSEALRRIGIDIDPPQTIEGVYPDMSHADDWDAACQIAGRWVDDDMGRLYADTFCLVGDTDHCVEKLQVAADCGIKSFYIRHFSSYTLPTELVDTFSREVLPRFRAAGRVVV
jgi:5,10-methylenetetrahydromethanopterin reductase